MGGSALKNLVYTRRYERDEFLPIAADAEYRLRTLFGRARVVPYYKNKDSFGDLDILCENEEGLSNDFIQRYIVEEFNPTAISVNDRCFSFNIDELQVDAIFEAPKFFDIHLNYLSYNDLGNLVGRIAKSVFNVKYGHKGLTAPVRVDNTHEVAELEISIDQNKILKFLGFNPDYFQVGFLELEDVFNYVINSKFFHKSFFDLSALNHINRTRNRKRASYQKFLKFLEENVPDSERVLPAYTLDEFFPEADFTNKAQILIEKAVRYKQSKRRVLNCAQKLYSGVDMGVKMAKFKKYIEAIGDYAELVEKMQDDEITQLLQEV